MESTSWKGPDVWHLSWHGPAVPALAQTLTFPWPEHSAQLNSEVCLSDLPIWSLSSTLPAVLCAFTALGSGNLPVRLCVLFWSVSELTVLLTLRFLSSKAFLRAKQKEFRAWLLELFADLSALGSKIKSFAVNNVKVLFCIDYCVLQWIVST